MIYAVSYLNMKKIPRNSILFKHSLASDQSYILHNKYCEKQDLGCVNRAGISMFKISSVNAPLVQCFYSMKHYERQEPFIFQIVMKN